MHHYSSIAISSSLTFAHAVLQRTTLHPQTPTSSRLSWVPRCPTSVRPLPTPWPTGRLLELSLKTSPRRLGLATTMQWHPMCTWRRHRSTPCLAGVTCLEVKSLHKPDSPIPLKLLFLLLPDSTKKPGPGAYSPEKVSCNKMSSPKYSLGIRHSEYVYTPHFAEVQDWKKLKRLKSLTNFVYASLHTSD